ncbi:MAG TPA: PDDEXK nuclease domain-containing protein [Longimicrobium sp.]|nr:PDDEXK nuclease domain-containing protein [Longimicrobium sp.]
MPRQRAVTEAGPDLPGYGELLEALKARIRGAQVRAALAANRELIALYWDIGRAIVGRQQSDEWGTSVIERLSRDLRDAFPDAHGFSPRNLWRIRAFYLAWSEPEILPRPVAEIPATALRLPLLGGQSVILPQPVAEIAAGTSQAPEPNELFTLSSEAAEKLQTSAADELFTMLPDVAEILAISARSASPPVQSVILPQPVAESPAEAGAADDTAVQAVILPQAVAEIPTEAVVANPLAVQSVFPPQAVAEISATAALAEGPDGQSAILPQAVAELPWGHNIVLLEKLRTRAERLWYARMAAQHGWSRNVLIHQIETRLHQRSGQAVTNFDRTIPAAESDLVRELLKDPYHFDFVQLGAAVQERELERALLSNVQKFLMELGLGFALLGSQYHLEVGGQDYYLDLLFYHVRLRRHVVVELKIGAFQPEDAGKMNFYLAAVDDLVRRDGDHEPSIGLILCKERNRVVAEYALRGSTHPIGIAEFQLTERLPEPLQASLPSVREIERRLESEPVFGA